MIFTRTDGLRRCGTGLLNRTTNTAYALDGQVATLTAVNSATGGELRL
jgi:hypothetical protein